ncbi:MAG TPA: hypothetical protein VGI10_04985 [Polyangiaceae bacterium]|jgi:hypothetical protein
MRAAVPVESAIMFAVLTVLGASLSGVRAFGRAGIGRRVSAFFPARGQ